VVPNARGGANRCTVLDERRLVNEGAGVDRHLKPAARPFLARFAAG
jgi:hypothetical protein